ncbi:MAG: filamentous hemagglutinin N-terminal domain-containing protein [Verrucomicrobiota bacterium]
MANPAGMTVASGSAVAQASGSQLTVTTSQNAVLNWQSFNIGAGETTIFNQPSAYSLVVNNIHDANASQIYGSLQANGIVVLMNQRTEFFHQDRRSYRIHRKLPAAAKQRRCVGVQWPAAAGEHHQLRPDQCRQRRPGFSHRR